MRAAGPLLAGLLVAATGASSAVAQPQGPCFYSQKNYKGDAVCIAPTQRIPNMPGEAGKRIMSAKIPKGLRVVVCEGEDLSGTCMNLTASMPDFTEIGVGGRIASISSDRADAPQGSSPQTAPQQQGGYAPRPAGPPQQGYVQPTPAPYQPSSYQPAPQQGGYQAPQQQGYVQPTPPPQLGGYQPQPAQRPQQGNFQPPQQGGYQPQRPPQQGGYQPAPAPYLPPQQSGYQPRQQQGSFQPQQGSFQPQGGYQQPAQPRASDDGEREMRRQLRRECRRGDTSSCAELGRLVSQRRARSGGGQSDD